MSFELGARTVHVMVATTIFGLQLVKCFLRTIRSFIQSFNNNYFYYYDSY